ncbi:hypothetical protein GWO13_01725 [Candidatus Bathyarchaeota archaeon]|nr:hypothetical protein [Candidatus Bathyarchaeota archaeon]
MSVRPEKKRKLRQTFSGYFEKVALMAAAGLIFGQFVPGTEIDWRIVLGGTVLSVTLITFAGLTKENQNQAGQQIKF